MRAPARVPVVGARSKKSVSAGPGNQQADGDPRVLDLVAQRMRERVDESLAAAVDRVQGAGLEAGHRPGDQHPAAAARHHAAHHVLQQVDGAGDVGLDHVLQRPEVLLQEGPGQAMAGVGHQHIDLAALQRLDQGVHALATGQFGPHGMHLAGAGRLEIGHRLLQWPGARHDQVVPMLRGQQREVVADAGKSVGYHRQRAWCLQIVHGKSSVGS